MRLINLKNQNILAQDTKVRETFFLRLKGLLGKKGIEKGSALILKPCDSIHTFFMRFDIDVIFVDKHNRIIKIYLGLKPWRLSGIFLNAAFCIELPAGILQETHTQEGDFIQITP